MPGKIALSGDHYALGYGHGEACGSGIREFYDFAMNLFKRTQHISEKEVLDRAACFLNPIRSFCPHLARELEGVAAAAEMPLEAAVFLHVRTELSHHQKSGCSAFAVARERTAHGGMLAGQNWDNVPWYAERMIVLELHPEGKPSLLMVTFPGVIGYIGINSSGVSVWDNQLMCDGWKTGVPHYFLKRMILEQETVEDVIRMLRSSEPASSENFVVTDGGGRVASIECTPHGIGVLEPEGGIIAHTNHFLSPSLRSLERYITILPDTCDRLKRLCTLFDAHGDNLCVETMKCILSDHENFPQSLCRHVDHTPHSMATCSSVIAEPAEGRMHIARGNPCVRRYSTYELH